MATDLEVVNEALVKIGASPIASLQDVGAQATAARVAYSTVVGTLLAQTPWYWALKRVQLPEVSLADGEFDEFDQFDHIYQLPSDLVRSIGLASCEPFALIRDKLHTDDNDPVLVYVFRAEVTRWPDYFRDLVVKTLAGELAISVTDSSNRANLWLSRADVARPRAMAIDAQQTPNEVLDLMRIYTRGTTNPLATV
jgi:hypothetical protein